jgi:hypothetical protein
MELTNEELQIIETALACKINTLASALYDLKMYNRVSYTLDSYQQQYDQTQELHIKVIREIKSR